MKDSPRSQGYVFPAEWEPHEATWLTYPVHEDSFPGLLHEVVKPYHQFIRAISVSEKVRVNVDNTRQLEQIRKQMETEEMDLSALEFFIHPSDDVWCRDHGPCFVVNRDAPVPKAIVHWNFNAWGEKYPFGKDARIAENIAHALGLPTFEPGIVMEGGSIEVNGHGSLLTTEACLLNPNRNPGLGREQIESLLCGYYGVKKILWLPEGIEGDDTDGHIDDVARFVNEDTVVAAVEKKKRDNNYEPLQNNLRALSRMRLASGKQIQVAEIPMPVPIIENGQRFPASYANFYITNKVVIVPLFQCKQDDEAMEVLGNFFPGRKILGIDSTKIIQGFGSFHCLSQQEPAI